MSPESKARSSYGPLPRRSTWLAGTTLMSLTLVLAGASSPVLAVAQPAKATTAANVADATDGEECRPGDNDGSCSDKPNGNGLLCNDIDAYRPNGEEVRAVTYNGETFAGIRSLTPSATPFVWSDLSDNADYPKGACSVAIVPQNGSFSVELLTKTGEIWRTECTITQGTPDTLVCNAPWVEGTTPFENGVMTP